MRLSGLYSLKSNEMFARGRGRPEVALEKRGTAMWMAFAMRRAEHCT